MHYVLSQSPDFTAGWLAARHVVRGAHHLRPGDALAVVRGDTVEIIGGWDRAIPRRARVRIEKILHDSGAHITNGAGRTYDWGSPKPWEHDGDTPGSAMKKTPHHQELPRDPRGNVPPQYLGGGHRMHPGAQ